MDFGVFIPIGNNGWLISENAPQYMPSFELNKRIVQEAEAQDFAFALSMIKLRGFGGKTEFWDHNLESFTLMAGLAAVTEKIKLYASTAVLTLPPALVARMATTIDSIAPGRFGVNIVSGWASGEYSQMGLWPGDQYFGERYDYSTEYVQVLRALWETGTCDLDGKYFQMTDCKLSPQPSAPIDIVCAGQSERGMRFCAEHGDYNFILSPGVNTPETYREPTEKLAAAAAASGRDVGSLPLFMAIMADTDEEAQAKWKSYHDGADLGALGYMSDEGFKDTSADSGGTARTINLPEGAVNFNMATLVGSPETVARQIDEVAKMPGVKGMMFTFDDFEKGVKTFGEKVRPLLG
ncbi:pyrimidine utilization protein A [Modestobacter sp. Leaf380]|uniref:pyrimidine utilization protein A n=1 Tax=Modestobacter sp. Leaf380 TaxID=1736356 RepID=UPI000702017F|nr:pyrimidine utilization protein A [Modestobacter sp. Leaf380]KQS66550.1 pyrimidine utilization protein A [Modestobacter sp. Leaf380]